MKKIEIRNEAIRDCLRIIDYSYFPNDPYNIQKDILFLSVAELLH